eukprot:SAG11_NODE_456_length_9319_cov_5.131128_8_plen_178_part_00
MVPSGTIVAREAQFVFFVPLCLAVSSRNSKSLCEMPLRAATLGRLVSSGFRFCNRFFKSVSPGARVSAHISCICLLRSAAKRASPITATAPPLGKQSRLAPPRHEANAVLGLIESRCIHRSSQVCCPAPSARGRRPSRRRSLPLHRTTPMLEESDGGEGSRGWSGFFSRRQSALAAA